MLLKSVQTREDAEPAASLLKVVFNEEPSVVRLYKSLYYHYQLANHDYFLFIKDESRK
ncbi:MAG: hypothetical protein JW891_12825 [Candidatus Lokiarchaeota archaeon]|nr:hypothetical protein [Candidatus Lokiarchaeota archaeon]